LRTGDAHNGFMLAMSKHMAEGVEKIAATTRNKGLAAFSFALARDPKS
jgi:hypothetical protein